MSWCKIMVRGAFLRRVHPYEFECPKCKHRFGKHNKHGCNENGCVCAVTNPTFEQQIRMMVITKRNKMI